MDEVLKTRSSFFFYHLNKKTKVETGFSKMV